MAGDSLLAALREALPDRPRWVEARGLLLSGRCEVLLGPEGRRGGGYLVLEHGRPLVVAGGRPVAAVVEELLAEHPEYTEVLAPMELAQHLGSLLPGWVPRPATIHVHADPGSLPEPAHEVRLLGPEDHDLWEHLPLRLAREVALAVETAPIAAALEGGRAVSFCYAPYETESWWDISVDTLEEVRRRGYASSAAGFLIHVMLERGKSPVWGALDANRASLAMAAKYGFRAVDRMVLFTPEGEARAGAGG